jgi:hypothetical protein
MFLALLRRFTLFLLLWIGCCFFHASFFYISCTVFFFGRVLEIPHEHCAGTYTVPELPLTVVQTGRVPRNVAAVSSRGDTRLPVQ